MRLRQLVARGGRRAYITVVSSMPVNGVCFFTYIALSADHLVTVVFGSESLEGGLNESTTETENEMKGGFLRNCISICCSQISN